MRSSSGTRSYQTAELSATPDTALLAEVDLVARPHAIVHAVTTHAAFMRVRLRLHRTGVAFRHRHKGERRIAAIAISKGNEERPSISPHDALGEHARGGAVDALPVCTTCEMRIGWQPHVEAGAPFCCAGCGAGGPCVCSYDGAAE